MITLYGIANCDTCRKAKIWFGKNNIPYNFIDFRKSGLSRSIIKSWVNALGTNLLVNRRGTTWRNLPEDRRLLVDGSDSVDVLMDAPTLMKRPIIDLDGRLLVGFDSSNITEIQSFKS